MPDRISSRDAIFWACAALDSAGALGAELDGVFVRFRKVSAVNAIAVSQDLPVEDAAPAMLPCSGGTAMNMALMAGASGGVGSSALLPPSHAGSQPA